MRMPVESLKQNPLVMLVDEVSRMQGRVKSLFAEVHADTGLRPVENLVLNAIEESASPPSVSQIARSIGQPRQVIQRAVNELDEAGYIKKLPNPAHKNVPLLALKAKGSKLKEKSNARSLAIAEEFLSRVDRDHYRDIALALKVMRKELETFSREKTSEK